MATKCFSLANYFLLVFSVAATHFRGGIIQWKPIDSNMIEIFHRVSWRLTWNDYARCTTEEQPLLGSSSGLLQCRRGCLGDVGSMQFYCTDSNIPEDWVTGTRAYQYTLPVSPSTSFEASFQDCCWISTLQIGHGNWELRVKGDLKPRPDGKINSSPVTSSIPILRLQHGCHHVYQIPVEDPDRDIIKCRWARFSLEECADVCNAFPNATLDEDKCTITYNATGNIGAYAVALQIEDYLTASSTEPMSSVPLQFLVNVTASNQSCFERPVLISPTPQRGSCIAIPLNTTYATSLIAHSEDIEVPDFETVSPRGFERSMVNQSLFNTSIYYINITWTPTIEQFGLNIFCFSAENVHRVTSEQSCITLVVGISGPRVLPTSVFPTGSFSPSPKTVWKMEFDQPVGKPMKVRSINIYEMGVDIPVESISVDSSAVIFPEPGSNGTIVRFTVSYKFETRKTYYVLVDTGFAVGEQFCKQESVDIYNTTFWTIEIPSIKFSPRFGNSLGGTAIMIEPGIDLTNAGKIECQFGVAPSEEGRALNSSIAICVSPFLPNTSGFFPFKLRIGERRPQEAMFLAISPEQGHALSVGGKGVTLLITPGDSVHLTWDPYSLVPNGLTNNVTVDISFNFLIYATDFVSNPIPSPLLNDTENDGEEDIAIDYDADVLLICTTYLSISDFNTVCPIHLSISISPGQYLSSAITIWSGTLFLQGPILTSKGTLTQQCQKWHTQNMPITPSLQQLSECPPNEFVASFDLNFMKEDMISSVTSNKEYHEMFMNYFHPDISKCYRQSSPNKIGQGQQCCYGNSGILVWNDPGGSSDASSPLSNYYAHILRDLLPYIICCRNTEIPKCDMYFSGRPSGKTNNYRFLRPGSSVGDPHIFTLDGLKYTFNGKGEFILVQTDSNIFTVQGRMEQILDSKGNLAPGTVFTAIVANQRSPDVTVQFEVQKSDGSLRTMVDSEEVNFGDINTLKFEGVALLDKGSNTILALFSGGAYVEVSIMNGIIEVLMVGLPDSLKRKTKGLMGTFNNIISDDLMPNGGQQSILIDSSMEAIHNDFGITWIIDRASDSLFSYKRGENYRTFYFPDFTPMFGASFTNDTLEKEAKKICGDDTFCLFDIAATGRVEIGMATKEGVEMVNTIEEMTKPITCEPPCSDGVCTENNMCSCNKGFKGDRCDEPIIEVCPQNPCQNNGICSKQGSTETCTCPPEFTGILCQTKVPPLSIAMLNGSPRVNGNQVDVSFSVSKPASISCIFDGIKGDCSFGFISFKNVNSGSHLLRLVASTSSNERAFIRRRIYIGPCAIHFINDGVTVNDRDVTIEFSGTPDATLFRCRIDRSEPDICRSPLRYGSLSPGQHKVVIEPRSCSGSKDGRLSTTFII